MLKYRDAIIFVIFIIIGFAYAIMKINPEISKIISIEGEIREKGLQISDLERKLEILKTAEKEKIILSDQMKNIFKPQISGLDAEASFTVLFDDIIDMAKYNGIKIYAIEYVYNPSEDEVVKGAADKYNVCQLNMQIIADYADLENFLKELYKYPYIIGLEKLEITPYPKNRKILMAIVQVKLYTQK